MTHVNITYGAWEELVGLKGTQRVKGGEQYCHDLHLVNQIRSVMVGTPFEHKQGWGSLKRSFCVLKCVFYAMILEFKC